MNPPATLALETETATTLTDLPKDLGSLSTTDLQELVSAAAEKLASVQNGITKERYLTVLAALEGRSDPSRGRERALKPQNITPENTKAYNNHLHGRYELFVDGTMVAHLKYEMHGGELWALRVSVDPDYRRRKVHTLLIEEVLADSLRRRVAVLPFCPETRIYLASKPEYHRLVPREHLSRFVVRSPQASRRRRQDANPATSPGSQKMPRVS